MSNIIDPGSETEKQVSELIVQFAAAAGFQGLSKPARKSMFGETPMPSHPDLRPKKVDSFIKKFLKCKGENFNTAKDRCQVNLAGGMLDPLAPLSHLWQSAISAEAEGTGADPRLFNERFRRANFAGVFSPRKRKIQLLSKPGKTKLTGMAQGRKQSTLLKQTDSESAIPVQSLISSRLKIAFLPVVMLLAGRLSFFLPNWHQITLNPAILDAVRGYKLEFSLPPIQYRIKAPPRFSHSESEKNQLRNYRPHGKRSIERGQDDSQPVSKQHIFVTETGQGIPLADQSEGLERIDPIRSLRNGRHSPPTRPPSASGLAGEN